MKPKHRKMSCGGFELWKINTPLIRIIDRMNIQGDSFETKTQKNIMCSFEPCKINTPLIRNGTIDRNEHTKETHLSVLFV